MARSSSARLRGRLAFLALLALTGSASATITLSQFPPNPGVLPGGGWQFTSGSTFANPPPPRAWVNGVYGSVPSATVSDSISLTGRAGALAVTARTTVTAAEVALSLARLAGRASAPIAIGSIAYDMFKASGIRSGASGAEIDIGADMVTTNKTMYGLLDFPNVPLASSKAAICKAWKDYIQNAGGTSASSSEYNSVMTYSQADDVDTCVVNKTTVSTPKIPGLSTLTSSALYQRSIYVNNSAPVKSCPDAIDSLTGQTYTPGTYSDGKCITGRYQSALESDIVSRLRPVVDSNVSEAAKGVISQGGEIALSDFSTSGPLTQIGQPTNTTTTTPSGTTTTSTYSSFSYDYNGDKITYETTNVTNTCAGIGSCSTNNADTTTTTTIGKTTGQDPADPCTSDPSRLGCLKLGDPPDDKISRNNKTVTFTPEALGLGGSCPAPVQLPHGQQISYQTVCDGVVQARPLIIAMGFLMAGGIMLGALRPQ